MPMGYAQVVSATYALLSRGTRLLTRHIIIIQGFRDGYYARYGYQARPAESYQNYPPREASDGNYYPYPLPTISASYSTRTDHAYQPYPNLPISPEAESAYRRFVTDTPPLEPTVSPAPELSPRNNGRESWYSTTPTTGIPADEEWGYPCAASDTDNEAQATDAAASTPRSNMSTLSIESTLRRTRLDDVDDDNEQDNVRHDDETEPRIAFTRGGDILLIGEAWQVPDRAAALRDAGPLTGSHEVRSVHESVNEHGEPSPTDVIEPCCEGDLTMAGGLLF
ncbi:hypothetical protein AAE478_000807 [Parahypoxylon ruwenzoriense]